jgi:hypothetical protein
LALSIVNKFEREQGGDVALYRAHWLSYHASLRPIEGRVTNKMMARLANERPIPNHH